MSKSSLIFVFIGGGLGSIIRYTFSALIPYKSGFPLATFTANIIACFVLGLLLAYSVNRGMSEDLKLLLLTGFCGGFSTFSTFSGETLKMLQQQQYTLAASYVLTSIVVGVGMVLFGYWMINR